MKSADWMAFLLAMGASAPAWSQATDQLVQAPELSAPERGSLVGQYARTAFGPADVSRGGYQLPAPMAARMRQVEHVEHNHNF